MSKDLSISVLMDFYGGLLTDKQRDSLELYYEQDCSLAEIAGDMDISRQGVRDFIKRGEKQLYEFEEKLELVKKYNDISSNISRLEEMIDEIKLDETPRDTIKNIIEDIKKEL
ncbi:MAG: putative DNA-binding protein [Clostridia bacterium]|nr:putative DNA-binding protein [Clostridia bacterium]